MPTELTDRFAEAARWAAELHRDHYRKGNGIPYVSHLFAVAPLVLEDGGSEDGRRARRARRPTARGGRALTTFEYFDRTGRPSARKTCAGTTSSG